MIEALVHFPQRDIWASDECWVRPSQVAALRHNNKCDGLVYTNVLLASGGEIYLREYTTREVAEMLGFIQPECPHGISDARCDDCYATGLLKQVSENGQEVSAIAMEAAAAGETVQQGSTRSATARVRKDIAQPPPSQEP